MRLLWLLAAGLTLFSCKESGNHVHYPLPTGKTSLHSQGEDENRSRQREAWISMIHGGEHAPWRTIEAENQQASYQHWLEQNLESRGNDEWLANGQILGKWIERGSNNNAGNVMVVDYDAKEDVIYAVGGGGPMFKGDFSGQNWEVVNDKLRFSTNLLKVFHLDDGKHRIVSAINGTPHFSEDRGITWIKATGLTPTSDGWTLYNSQTTRDGIICFLGRKDYWGSIRMYASFDFGKTFKTVKLFNTSDTRNVSMGWNAHTDEILVIEQLSATQTKLYRLNKTTKLLDTRNASMPIGFGENGAANLQVATLRDTNRIYVFTEDKSFFTSPDEGKSWKKLSKLTPAPWDVGVYVCPSDPTRMIYGEVDAFTSQNGGLSWQRVNEWWEYYDNIYGKLHADIMFVKEFNYADGKPFLLNANHGGLYYSEDYGKTNTNIGLYNLNVSQYYDVRTYPSNPDYIFAGSQDQGQQRGSVAGEETAELFQNISGDYGHIEFTGNGEGLWSVYPGGWVGFYSQPLIQNYPIAGYEIKSSNETVWIPPLMPGPDPSKHEVYVAGGSTTPTSGGSHLIRLTFENNEVKANELPFNFATSGGQVSAMAIDPIDKNNWFVATTNGKFYRSTDGGQQFTKTAEMLSESHYLYGSCILPSVIQSGILYLSGNGYSNAPVYKSVDGGRTFEAYSKGLPKTTVFNVVANEDETLLFAAAESGPYVCFTHTGQWYPLSGISTPNQTFWSVEYVAQTKTVRFATYGRGVWDLQIKDVLSSTQSLMASIDNPIIYPNPARDAFRIKTSKPYNIQVVTISDLQGRIIARHTIFDGGDIPVQDLPAGTYMVHIYDGSRESHKKLVISR